jgi:hypothetical protein
MIALHYYFFACCLPGQPCILASWGHAARIVFRICLFGQHNKDGAPVDKNGLQPWSTKLVSNQIFSVARNHTK